MSVQRTARRDKHAIVHTIKSLTDDNELFPFIEAIPDALYNPGQVHKVRPDNVVLLTPLLLSIDPELNILIRIAQFVSKSSYWSDNVRAQYSLACTRALWTLAWNYVDIRPVQPWNTDHLRQFVSRMLSFLKSVNSSPLAHDIWSALAAICFVWMHTLSDSKQTSSHLFIYRDLVKAISHEADFLPMIDTSFSRDMLAKIIRSQRAYTVKWIAVIDSLKPSETWHVIQLLCLHRYLVDSQKSFTSLKTLPGDFEWMCDTIYPYSKAPLEVKDNSENIPCLLYTGDFLLALEQYIDETGVLNDSTDTLMRQHLRLFLSTSTPPVCSRDEARQCRQFVLRYLHMRYEDCPLHGIWEKFDVGDLKRVGQCILEHIQDPLNNTEQSSVCLKVAFIFVSSDAYTLRVFRRTGDFFPKLFICLHNGPLNTAFKEADGYMLFKTLLDLVVCPRLVPPGDLYEPLPLENLEQTRAKLVQEYLLPYFLSLNTLNSLSYQYTLTIAIASRYINLSCKSKVPSHCIGALNKLGLPGTWQDVHEKVQEIFAESITNLVNTKINENTVPESVKLALLDAMAFLPSRPGDAPWKWVTSRRSAEILLRAISQNPGLQNVQILEMYRDLEEEGERGTKRLLKHCRQLISMAELGENVIDRNSSES
ncbi:hypothetical protein VKT23_001234 [Stygiomarasmius scandens]|uniref:Uncharacterized protein n=1 Tax=Marasmiellus scandens TaxID=2682957 RepID=A0ABR1KBW2_9AGAR